MLGTVSKNPIELFACDVKNFYIANDIAYASFGSGIHQVNLTDVKNQKE